MQNSISYLLIKRFASMKLKDQHFNLQISIKMLFNFFLEITVAPNPIYI